MNSENTPVRGWLIALAAALVLLPGCSVAKDRADAAAACLERASLGIERDTHNFRSADYEIIHVYDENGDRIAWLELYEDATSAEVSDTHYDKERKIETRDSVLMIVDQDDSPQLKTIRGCVDEGLAA